MASYVPNAFKGRLMGDTAQIGTAVNLASDTVKAMFLTASHTPDADAEVFIDDVSANEISASGSYSAGGITLTKSSSTDDTDDEGVFDATDISATTFTGAVRYIAIYKDTGTPGTSPIIAVIDLGATYTATNGTLSIPWAAEGILNLN
jgi:hypothetical protein